MPVVVGYIATAEGRAALRRAAQECALRRTDLVVINSARPDREHGSGPSDGAQAELDRVRAELDGLGIAHQVRELTPGSEPAEDLVAVAEETDADLIVIGLRRRSPVGKLILGSNAQRVLLEAPCAVLAVKAQRP